MKKILSLVLVVAMMMSMTVTAFAAVGDQSGTSTLTAVVPEPEYTIHIPANMTLEYGLCRRSKCKRKRIRCLYWRSFS